MSAQPASSKHPPRPAQPATQERARLGREGERLAALHLVSQGWEILAQNLRLARGEIDLIARIPHGEGTGIAVVEVKTRRATRRSARAIPAHADMTARKRQKVAQLARQWVQVHGLHAMTLRLDVISICLDEQWATLRHYKGAFDGDGRLR